MVTRAKNVRGKSGDVNRGKWCTRGDIATALGRFDLDPFSNPHSRIVADETCMLERGGDGFGDGETPGSYRTHRGAPLKRATANTRPFLQPPYDDVDRVLRHYEHTRWTALLRFDPRVSWFRRLYRRTALVLVLWSSEFEPPPGVSPSSNSFPHALYFRRAEDVTHDVLRFGFAWRTGHGS